MVLTNITPPIALRDNQSFVTILTTPFERIATSVAERLAELLYTNIWVLDEQQTVLASRLPLGSSHDIHLNDHTTLTHRLRVPFHLNDYAGTVIIGTSAHGEVISPRLAHALTHLVINEALTVDVASQPGALKNALIFRLLQGVGADDTTILQEARLLGL